MSVVKGIGKFEIAKVFMKRRIDYVWCISLFVVGIATFILNGSNLIGIGILAIYFAFKGFGVVMDWLFG